MTITEEFLEKFKTPVSLSSVGIHNHIAYSVSLQSTNLIELNSIMKRERWNFVGITTAPYNPYDDADFGFAFVFEDIEDDFKIKWHHCCKKWLRLILGNDVLEEVLSLC